MVNSSPKQAKDKNKPKNAMSAYACFIQVIREEHRRKHPNEHVDFSEFSKKCAEKWRTMNENEKKRFEDMAQADRMRFNREMAHYVPPDGVRVKKRKMPKDPSKPKRAWSAFFFFCDEFRPQVRENHPDWRVGDVAKELGKMWEACADKSKYENLAQDARQKYEEEMAQYRAGTYNKDNAPSDVNQAANSVAVNQNTNQTIVNMSQPQSSSAAHVQSQSISVPQQAQIPQQMVSANAQQQILMQQVHSQQQQMAGMGNMVGGMNNIAQMVPYASALMQQPNQGGQNNPNVQQMQHQVQQQHMIAAMQQQAAQLAHQNGGMNLMNQAQSGGQHAQVSQGQSVSNEEMKQD